MLQSSTVKKAVILTAFFYSSVTNLSVAFGQSKKSNNISGVIERSHNLLLQNDRQQALSLLYRTLKKEAGKPAVTAELKKNIEEIGQLFLSDKAQQLFEVSLSLRKSDLNQAQLRLSEALKIEADNVQLVTEMARLYIIKGDCSAAQELVSKNRDTNYLDEALVLADVQARLCAKALAEIPPLLPTAASRKASSQSFFWTLVDLERAYLEGKHKQAADILHGIKKIDAKAPIIDWWTYRLAADKEKVVNLLSKYVMTCKNISAAQYRQYMIDPNLCKNIGELENEIKALRPGTE